MESWFRVIDEMENENTYKLAWGRSIVELCFNTVCDDDEIIFTFNQIGQYFLKYYWNQTYFFRFYQGPAKSKPRIQQITEEMIAYYKTQKETTLPVWFDYAKPFIENDNLKYEKFLNAISTTMKENVAWRFTKIGPVNLDLYELSLSARTIKLTKQQHQDIKEHSFILSQLLNYRWAQLLEKFNHSPRIALKVKGLSDEQLRRNSLSDFKKALLLQFPDGIVRDFYTNDILDPKDISIDHVIPWSFMYSDDIWNLVITSKSNNAIKSNKIPTQENIEKLKLRNEEIEKIVPDCFSRELREASKHEFVDRFYFDSKL